MHTFNILITVLALVAPAWSQIITGAPSSAIPLPTAACSLTSLMPACGVPCISAAANSVGCAVPMDFACHCAHGPAMQAYVKPCVASACGAQAPVVGSVANAICTACVATPTAVATSVA